MLMSRLYTVVKHFTEMCDWTCVFVLERNLIFKKSFIKLNIQSLFPRFCISTRFIFPFFFTSECYDLCYFSFTENYQRVGCRTRGKTCGVCLVEFSTYLNIYYSSFYLFFRLYGDYESLTQGDTADALVDFTGGVAEKLALMNINIQDDLIKTALFRKLRDASENSALINCNINVSVSMIIVY